MSREKVTHNHYHHCASCQHFVIETSAGQKKLTCSRLGYETKPHYQFNCWDPKPRVIAAMLKKNKSHD